MRALPGLLERLKRGDVSQAGMLACLSVIWLGLVATQLSPCVDMNPDSAIYIELARSIAQGRGYTLEGLFCRGYPPGFSLMLSAVTSPERRDYRPEKLIAALGALGAMLGGYWLLSQRYEGRALVVLAVLVAVSPSFLRYCVKLRSDIPFMFFALIFMAAATSYWRAERVRLPVAVLAAVALSLGVLTRTAGLVFYPVALAWLVRPSLWRRDARRSIVFAAALAIIALPAVVGWAWCARTHSSRAAGV
ncbi:MAG: glycosyltransferase family 39 protein, partial [Candidatus Brocadiia bacterium]|nr:glycosyltransferase family 39 protein [Candidatus Brocadiia bacterium]